MISSYEHGRAAAQHGKHIQACPFDSGTNAVGAIGSVMPCHHQMIRLVSWR